MQYVFKHTHPYNPFIDYSTEKLIVGTLPPPRFTTGELKDGDVDFCYGSKDGQLWPILNKIFDLNLKFETTVEAIAQRKAFLKHRKIGVCDIVASAEREKIDASDIGMQNIELRDVLSYLEKYTKVHTLLFTGGNSKNGPEYFFRKHLKEYSVSLVRISDEVPRIHEFIHPSTGKTIKTVSLIAPSGAANRAVGSLKEYKKMKLQDATFNTVDFRVLQYKDFF
ncbi:G/U mismatch-specific uracil-DNA glycosylase [Maribacter caenipelagi]|uniref:G/U mismatch-specific uracil-DNA glycosylase n=1 Tax=Maribacter caenipelagi TaxID=1447781 RepID=A0A4R7CT96_9FLAO|nr:uracil-DNA glycosylase family protein [Maribacter caenipelagi]TDS11619.1 G/U mismatch-specific uracil-DNA glycosylase [Maribacter caenipelagi]